MKILGLTGAFAEEGDVVVATEAGLAGQLRILDESVGRLAEHERHSAVFGIDFLRFQRAENPTSHSAALPRSLRGQRGRQTPQYAQSSLIILKLNNLKTRKLEFKKHHETFFKIKNF